MNKNNRHEKLQKATDHCKAKNEGKENMEVIVKKGKEITHYKSSGNIGGGQGLRAGTAYKMDDGSMIYVPEGKDNEKGAKQWKQ